MALPIRGYERHLIRTDAEWIADDAVIPLGWTAFGYTGTTLTKVAFGNGDDAYSLLTNSLTGGGGGATDFTDLGDVPASYTGASLQVVRVNVGETALEFATIGALTDGDKGDITVSSGGTVWEVDNDTITEDKLANVPEFTFRGRDAAGTGNVKNMVVDDACILLDTATDPYVRTSALSASGLTHPQVMARAQFASAF